MTALLVSTGVTVFALLAGTGAVGGISAVGERSTDIDLQRYVAAAATSQQAARQEPAVAQTPAANASPSAKPAIPGTGVADAAPSPTPTPSATGSTADGSDGSDVAAAVPAGSGGGRRVVFDISQQRVWLVTASGATQRTYLVSGSLTDNLKPGHYNVYSRSRYAVGVDDSGTMQYFVRFTRGANAAIGFHDIPVDHGTPLQTERQLGTPQSHGCIRQARPDAIRLWDFAPTGTAVVVVA